MTQYRHGDVLAESVIKLPEVRRKPPHTILAHGELAGHCRRIEERNAAALYNTLVGMFLHVTADMATLVYDEHDAISLASGFFRV